MDNLRLQLYESRILTLENETRRLSRRMTKREKLFSERIRILRREIRDQSSEFERKLTRFTSGESDSDNGLREKANGDDPPSSRRDALETRLESEEPLIMDRVALSIDRIDRFDKRPQRVSYSSSATQTDAVFFNEEDEDVLEEQELLLEQRRTDGTVPNVLVSSGDSRPIRRRENVDRLLLESFAIGNKDMDQLELAAEGFIDDTDFDEECQQELYDVEYEEVTLKRSDGCEKLGLTLCYGKGDDVDTDIFVSEIEEKSIACQDGRIRIGDQILQINGVDVHTRNEAMEQFRRDRSDITLLLARSVANGGEYSQDLTTMNDTIPEVEERSCSVIREQTPEDEDGHLTDGTKGSMGSAHEKDSGISRATDSDPELPPPINSPSKTSQKSNASNGTTATTIAAGKDDYFLDLASHFATKCDVERRRVGDESEQSSAATPTQANQRSIAGSDTPKGDASSNGALSSTFNWRLDSDDASLERELHYLHAEMEHIQLECDRLIEQHARSENQVRAQMEQDDRLTATVMNFQKQKGVEMCVGSPIATPTNRRQDPPPPTYQQRRGVDSALNTGRFSTRDETSSAYNTGNESCRSTPLKTVGLASDSATTSMWPAVGTDGKRDSAMFTLPNTFVYHPDPAPTTQHVPVQMRRGAAVPTSAIDQAPFYVGDVMYTNSENLQRTILLQQRLLRQAMIQQAQQLRAQHQMQPQSSQGVYCQYQPQHQQQLSMASANWTDNDRMRWLSQQQPHATTQTFNEGDIVKMEWKIKRRSDGSRYLARRPVRNKILKERAEKLSNERCGVSTDDDAFSELKVGRYWTREERKKHLERGKERKRRQEELLRRKNESLRQTSDQPILQLSNKKMLRRQGQQLFDKFTTVQEFLAHGSRTVEGAGRSLGILSVTTV